MTRTFPKLPVIFLLALFTACTKKNDTPTAPVNTTAITINVKDADSWSSVNTSLSSVSGATVYLYDSQAAVTANTPTYTQTTGANGSVTIPVSYQSTYFILVKKNTSSSIYNGYLISGVFLSADDIKQSAIQTNSSVGWPKLTDLNGDGKIDANDQPGAGEITTKQNETVTNTAFIAQPIASSQIALTTPVYPVLQPNPELAGQCEGAITASFTCTEKYWDSTTQALIFVDESKTLREVNGVNIVLGIGYQLLWNLSGDLNVGTTAEGPAITYKNVTINNGTVTGTVSALIEPGSCATSPNYQHSYVQNLNVRLCYSTLGNVFQTKGGVIYVASNAISVAVPGS